MIPVWMKAGITVLEENDPGKAEPYLIIELYNDDGELLDKLTTKCLKLGEGESGQFDIESMSFPETGCLFIQPIEYDPDHSRWAGLAAKAAQKYKGKIAALSETLYYGVIGAVFLAGQAGRVFEEDDLWPAFSLPISPETPLIGETFNLEPIGETGPRAAVVISFSEEE